MRDEMRFAIVVLRRLVFELDRGYCPTPETQDVISALKLAIEQMTDKPKRQNHARRAKGYFKKYYAKRKKAIKIRRALK